VYALRRLDADDPFVVDAVARYLLKWRIRRPEAEPEKSWWGLFSGSAGETLVLAFAYIVRADDGIELTDVYLEPTRRGLSAVRYAGEALKEALTSGTFPYCMASTFFGNKRAIKWAKDFLGIEPVIAGFVAPGSGLDDERRAILGAAR
jgi:hypothetical protein